LTAREAEPCLNGQLQPQDDFNTTGRPIRRLHCTSGKPARGEFCGRAGTTTFAGWLEVRGVPGRFRRGARTIARQNDRWIDQQ